ncbi:apolipoprotein D isoform X2 [Anabrus simplex]|uniref:apolipoprotein D isoform X2 n=1 Tax=Anabrus simplex TaxID=316456 RepID=UPI0035A310DD
MEEPIFIKCEPGWVTETEETSNFGATASNLEEVKGEPLPDIEEENVADSTEDQRTSISEDDDVKTEELFIPDTVTTVEQEGDLQKSLFEESNGTGDPDYEFSSMEKFLKCTATLLVACIGISNAQVPMLGPCPDLPTMGDFNLVKYLGRWYEAERYFALFEFAGKCVSANYTASEDGRVLILNRQTSALTGIRSTIEGEVKQLGRTDESKLSVKFPSLPVTLAAPYWVLDTDYDNFSVVWSCSNFGLFSTRNAWILTRARHPPLEVMERAYAVVDKNGISRAFFIRTDQKNCPSQY